MRRYLWIVEVWQDGAWWPTYDGYYTRRDAYTSFRSKSKAYEKTRVIKYLPEK